MDYFYSSQLLPCHERAHRALYLFVLKRKIQVKLVCCQTPEVADEALSHPSQALGVDGCTAASSVTLRQAGADVESEPDFTSLSRYCVVAWGQEWGNTFPSRLAFTTFIALKVTAFLHQFLHHEMPH